MTGKMLHGYLDRLRENVEVLDEAIANARKMSQPGRKGADKAAALQWAKTLRDLVELRNNTLGNIKAHLLGRGETGAANEPDDIWEGNSQVEYERYFKNRLSPWTLEDLKLECKDCGVKSEDVSDYYVEDVQEHFDLCPKCYRKREAKEDSEKQIEKDDSTARSPTSDLSGFEHPREMRGNDSEGQSSGGGG